MDVDSAAVDVTVLFGLFFYCAAAVAMVAAEMY